MSIDDLIYELLKSEKEDSIINDVIKLALSLRKEFTALLWAVSKFKDYKWENFYGEGEIKIIEGDSPAKKDTAIFLLHGYGMNEGMNIISERLAERGYKVYSLTIPFLKPIKEQANMAYDYLIEAFFDAKPKSLAILGYSMGGLIGEWLLLSKPEWIKVSHFISLASPLDGTLTAFLGIGKSARDMQPNSEFLRKLKEARKKKKINGTNIYSIITTYDLFVIPAESALKNEKAINIIVPRVSHIGAIKTDIVSECVDLILTLPYPFFKQNSEYRNFSPSIFLRNFKRSYEGIKTKLKKLNSRVSELEKKTFFPLKQVWRKIKEKIEILESRLEENWKEYGLEELSKKQEKEKYFIISYPSLKEKAERLDLEKKGKIAYIPKK